MVSLIVNPTPIMLDVSKGIRRLPVRPAEFQINDYADKFDDSTLFFDAFFDSANENVIFLAPALLNLLPHVGNMKITALPSGKQCHFHIKNMDRHSRVKVPIPPETTKLDIASEFGRFEVTPNRNHSHLFEDKRVIFTLSKNNRLEWIADWIRYNRDVHGADAVLLYDNASSAYRPQELLDAIAAIPGIDCTCVVVWPFKFGPQGLDAARFWDSDFCQFGSLEHARWFALQSARSALNSDIDELVVSPSDASVFEAAERSWLGTVRFPGTWVYGIEGKTRLPNESTPLRFTDYDHYLRPLTGKKYGVISVLEDACPTKWAVVPRRCPERAQWSPHRIKDWINAIPKTEAFWFRHFREITDHWKYDRTVRKKYALDRFEYDKLAVSAYARVAWTV